MPRSSIKKNMANNSSNVYITDFFFYTSQFFLEWRFLTIASCDAPGVLEIQSICTKSLRIDCMVSRQPQTLI